MIETFVDVTLRTVGLFYALTAILVVRTIAVSHLADATYAALTGEAPSPAARRREIWLAVGAFINGVAGLALFLLLDVALPLFLLGLAQQVVYLVHAAPRWFDVGDAPDDAGRARTRSAAVVYGLLTALIAVAAGANVFYSWRDQPIWLLAGAGAIVAGGAIWTTRAVILPRLGNDCD